jgi:hypothetical protein
MLTETEDVLTVQDDIEEVEYPPEVIARWDREFDVLETQKGILHALQ